MRLYGSTMRRHVPTTVDVLPDDVLYEILYHSSVRDILALRQVSRKFYHLTHHRPIWANVYRRCPILLPPGPFSYQSAADIERTLKRGHLLEANWTSPSPRPASRQTITISSVEFLSNRMKLVGRYLLIAGEPMLRCYDLESKNEEFAPIAVYDSIEIVFDCGVEKHSVVDNRDCQLVCALASQRKHAITLLRLRISQCSAKFELMKEVRLPRPIHYHVKITGDILSMDSAYHGPMLLHIPTCQVYDLPPCDFPDNVFAYHGARSTFVVTSNHLLCYSFLRPYDILEVFPLPRGAPQPNDDGETAPVHILTRSHKCMDNYGRGTVLLTLLAERHDLHNNGHSVHYTFITMNYYVARLGFLDISLVSDLVTTTWTVAKSELEGEDNRGISMLMLGGSALVGVYRLVLIHRGETFALTVSDADGKRVIRGKPIVVDEGLTKVPYFSLGSTSDSLVQGRMCEHVSSGHIEVIDFA